MSIMRFFCLTLINIDIEVYADQAHEDLRTVYQFKHTMAVVYAQKYHRISNILCCC